jgi:hypothetical protein
MPRPTVPTVESLRPRGPLTFVQPTPTLDPSLTDPTSLPTDPTSSSALLGDSPSLSAEPTDESNDPSEGPRASSRGSSGSTLGKRALRDAVRVGVLAAGDFAHQVLARDEPAQVVELYRADVDDAEAIGDPLANIAQRHGGLGAAGNPDLADAIAALIGLALYATKQVTRWNAARALRRAATTQQQPADDAEVGA